MPHEPSSFSDEYEFAFRHNLIRDGAYDSLPKSLRADKHAGVARWAERRAGDRAEEIAELVATHELEALAYLQELGEHRPELQRTAFEHAWAAARRTSALWLGAESTRWYREAERLADALEIPLAERAQLHREHAHESWGRDTVAETERVARRAIEASTAAGDDPSASGWASARLVMPLMQQSRHEEAEQAGRAAIETLEPLGDSTELADALHRLGWFLWRRGREPEAEPMLRRAIDIADRVDATLVRAEATQTLAVCVMSLNRPGEAQPLMEEAFRLAKEAGDNTNLMRAYNNIATTRLQTQGPTATADVLREGLELALRSGTIANGGWISGSLGDAVQLLGRLEESEAHQRLAVDLARRVGDEPLIGQRLITLATVVLMRGRVDEAVAYRDEAAPIMAANPEPQGLVFVPQFDGYLGLARGDRAAVADRFAEAAEHVRAYSVDTYPEFIAECPRAFLLLGDRGRADTYRDLEGSTYSIQSAAHATNITGLLEPDPARSVAILREAVAEFERLETRIFAARAMVDLGRAMTRDGQDPRELLERARAILLECDANLFLVEVDEALTEVLA